jgi:3-hydroxyacyl-CoA dehydrogenase
MHTMSDLIQLTKDNDIAIITINNPPVNALSPGVPEGISDSIDQIEKDASGKAVVIIGGGRTFVAGADIKEFTKMTSGKGQRGPGLELAMSGHYRVAAPSAQVGQPEVKLGLIPGAAGTQRLPRLAGVAMAVEMCTGGNPVKASDALKAGIIDRLIEGDLLAGALDFAREIAGQPAPRTRDRSQKLGTPGENAAIFATARETVRKKQRNLIAPLAAIDAIEAATKLPFDQGCEVEAKLFIDCLYSDQSKALIHVFFGEREVAKIPDITKETPILSVNSAAVVGAGTMGGGIAMVFANAGIPVLLKDADQAALDRGLANIQKNYATSVARGRFTQQAVEERMKLIKSTLSYDDFSKVDMVIEAVFEGMRLKKKVFAELDRVCKLGAILASNTSTLDIDEIASATARPASVLGTHFFSPANVMRLLEIVRGKATGKDVLATCMQLAKKLGKIGVLAGNCRGFIGNRMFHPYMREATFLVEEGASVEAVDKALYDFGMAMGPLATGDLAGLDVGWRIRKEYRHLEKPGIRQPFASDRLCEMGRFGQKTGAGWYKYDENRRAIPDPETARLIRKWAVEAGIPQRQISAEEIVDRCIYALVNEGTSILEEGIALRAVDIDIVYINGYGFPAYCGGPMWYADTVGLKKVFDRVTEFHRTHGELWEPAPLLKRLAAEGHAFADLDKQKMAA